MKVYALPVFVVIFIVIGLNVHSTSAKGLMKFVKGCPYCDSSVFGYCTDKLLHDACCCLNPYDNQLPLECKYADCSFLHANSCRYHHLITRCCCNKYI
ncbi:uncharacterized protein LOC106665383 [Cimex lectularius]|uniref:CCC domain-containing protein n=1 Tax=Cimex lectularius TaxID=79782 RepID=A0A8I6RNP2_CIMLE|nr:uncharacterized protein LOC106665383 [Cimex lectularius]